MNINTENDMPSGCYPVTGDFHLLRLQKSAGAVGENVGFERTRRITGYLVGTLNRFNDAKRAEERDRVKHG